MALIEPGESRPAIEAGALIAPILIFIRNLPCAHGLRDWTREFVLCSIGRLRGEFLRVHDRITFPGDRSSGKSKRETRESTSLIKGWNDTVRPSSAPISGLTHVSLRAYWSRVETASPWLQDGRFKVVSTLRYLDNYLSSRVPWTQCRRSRLAPSDYMEPTSSLIKFVQFHRCALLICRTLRRVATRGSHARDSVEPFVDAFEGGCFSEKIGDLLAFVGVVCLPRKQRRCLAEMDGTGVEFGGF